MDQSLDWYIKQVDEVIKVIKGELEGENPKELTMCILKEIMRDRMYALERKINRELGNE